MMANDLGYLFTEINISKMYNMSTCPHTQKRLGIGRKRVTWCVLTMIRDYKVYQQNTESNKSIKTRKREREPNRDDQTKIAGIPFGTMANTSHLLSLAKLTTRNHSISFISSVSANRHTHTHTPAQTRSHILPFFHHYSTIAKHHSKLWRTSAYEFRVAALCFISWLFIFQTMAFAMKCGSFVPYQQSHVHVHCPVGNIVELNVTLIFGRLCQFKNWRDSGGSMIFHFVDLLNADFWRNAHLFWLFLSLQCILKLISSEKRAQFTCRYSQSSIRSHHTSTVPAHWLVHVFHEVSLLSISVYFCRYTIVQQNS